MKSNAKGHAIGLNVKIDDKLNKLVGIGKQIAADKIASAQDNSQTILAAVAKYRASKSK